MTNYGFIALVKAFALIDADGDGCITSDELVTVIEKVRLIMITKMMIDDDDDDDTGGRQHGS